MNRLLAALAARLRTLVNWEDGQDLIEYGLGVTLIALACIACMQSVAPALVTMFNDVSSSIT